MTGEGVSGGTRYSRGAGYGDGLPARHHGTATVAPETIRRIRPQCGAAFATRTGFADEDSSV